jgi:hypothetical protein
MFFLIYFLIKLAKKPHKTLIFFPLWRKIITSWQSFAPKKNSDDLHQLFYLQKKVYGCEGAWPTDDLFSMYLELA